QIDLVEDRDDLEARVEREEEVRERLRLHPLARVNDEDRALACRAGTGHLVREVDVSGRADEVQLARLAVARPVAHAHRVQLDRAATLALEVEPVEHLRRPLTLGERGRLLEQAVGQRRLAVIDMCDDAGVADSVELHAAAPGTRTERLNDSPEI